MHSEPAHTSSKLSAAAGVAEPLNGTHGHFSEEREALRRVLEYAEFGRSTSLTRFLSFICNKYFEGRAEEIREYTIAIEALGRRESEFDSRLDPIVRVTARALRKKLGAYYNSDGRQDPLRIVLPLGHYVPQFVPAPAEAEAETHTGDAADTEMLAKPRERRMHAADGGDWRRVVVSIGWKAGLACAVVAAAFAVGYLQGRRNDDRTPANSKPLDWSQPVWSEEFDGAAGELPDPSKWMFEVGGGGWGAKQEQTYCGAGGTGPKDCSSHRPSAFLDGHGHLVLRAEKNPDGVWTSARITTRGLKNFQYGRIEARLKMPVGKGLWPSFWMLGADFPTAGWPASGSFDLVENVSLDSGSNGLGPSVIRATVHGPHYYGANGIWHNFHLPDGARVDDGTFHTYGVIWSPGMLQFYVEDPANVYFVANQGDVPEGGQWVFDHPFFLLMNLAIGGDWPGEPDGTTPNPADMVVDYIRVYDLPRVPAPSIEWQPVEVRAGAAAASNVLLKSSGYSGRVFLSCATEPATATCSLATPVVNFSDTLAQQDTLTISTDSFSSSGRVAAPAGRYKVTLTATSMSGARSQLVVPFVVKAAN